MHIIGIIIALATAVFWVGRAARGAKDIVDIASSLKNMQRPSRFKSRNPQRDISIIDEPMDAAVILMICVGKLSSFGQMGKDQISTSVHSKILQLLNQYMQIPAPEATELLTQMLWSTQSVSQPEIPLSDMTDIMSKQINHKEAEDLSAMLRTVANTDGAANTAQEQFITRFGDRMGLSVA